MSILSLLASDTTTIGATSATSAATTSSGSATASCLGFGNNWTMWVFLGLMVVLLGGMWFMNSRRAKKQQKEREDRMNNLAIGDKIVTIGMWIGEIVAKNPDGTYVLQTGDAEHVSYITIQETAIYQIIKKEEAPVSDGVFEETVPAAQEPADDTTEEKKD